MTKTWAAFNVLGISTFLNWRQYTRTDGMLVMVIFLTQLVITDRDTKFSVMATPEPNKKKAAIQEDYCYSFSSGLQCQLWSPVFPIQLIPAFTSGITNSTATATACKQLCVRELEMGCQERELLQ